MELIRQDDEDGEKKLLFWVICNILSHLGIINLNMYVINTCIQISNEYIIYICISIIFYKYFICLCILWYPIWNNKQHRKSKLIYDMIHVFTTMILIIHHQLKWNHNRTDIIVDCKRLSGPGSSVLQPFLWHHKV